MHVSARADGTGRAAAATAPLISTPLVSAVRRVCIGNRSAVTGPSAEAMMQSIAARMLRDESAL